MIETNIKESIIDKTSIVYSKVDNINEMMIKNEVTSSSCGRRLK
ncbi:hypothetical protein ACF3M2_13955 [Tissierella carlieri]